MNVINSFVSSLINFPKIPTLSPICYGILFTNSIIKNHFTGGIQMLKRFITVMLEKIVFIGLLFALLSLLLIISDTSPLLFSIRFYFWSVIPLVIFSLIFALFETSYTLIIKKE
jgi:glucan phosphoethanolaminetransferase (alkaline phosphatase superfamily)